MPVIINGTTGVTFPNGVTMSDGTSAPVTVAQGGTGANTAANARTSLGTNDAANLTTGTLPDARFPATLPAASGANLTSLNASNVSSGTLAVARGGTGTASPSLVGGTNITISGTWPNQTVTAAGGGVTSLNGQTGAITDNTYNAISSYAQTYGAEGASTTVGNTVSGSGLRKINTAGSFANAGLTGTWRFMGSDEINGSGIYVRIS